MITYLCLILALSLDTFMAALSYMANKIKIPLRSNLVISFICAGALLISLLFGNILENILPHTFLKWLSFLILFIIGLFKIFDAKIKKLIKNNNFKSKNINFSFCNLKFILQIYSDFPKADIDKSKTLSSIEAISLAMALSIDGLSAGLAFHPSFIYMLAIFIICFIVNIFFIYLAKIISKIIHNIKADFSLLSGFIFIILAIFRINN